MFLQNLVISGLPEKLFSVNRKWSKVQARFLIIAAVIRGCVNELSSFLKNPISVSEYPCTTLNAADIQTDLTKIERTAICACKSNNCNLGPGIIPATTVLSVSSTAKGKN